MSETASSHQEPLERTRDVGAARRDGDANAGPTQEPAMDRSGPNRVIVEHHGRPSTSNQGRNGHSVLSDDGFAQRYAYGAAETAALSPGQPWSVVGAVGRDAGNFLLGSLGMKKGADDDPDKCEQTHCNIQKAKLKQQAKDLEAAEKEKEKEAKSKRQQDSLRRQAESICKEEKEKAKADGPESESSSSSDAEKDEKPSSFNIQRESTSSSASADITSSGSGHYEVNNDAILRLETMAAWETRLVNLLLWAGLTVALAFLLYEFSMKIMDSDAAVENFHQAIINVVIGTIMLVLVFLAMLSHCVRISLSIWAKKVWKPRRKYGVALTAVELIAMFCNLLFFVLPNYEILGGSCFKFGDLQHVTYYSLARWTCWNTLFLISIIWAHNACVAPIGALASSKSSGKKTSLPGRKSLQHSLEKAAETRKGVDVALMDAPFLQAHWWKLILWLLTEGSIICNTIYYGRHVPETTYYDEVNLDCGQVVYFPCKVSETQLGLVGISIFFIVLYFALYCFYIKQALGMLTKKSNTEFKIANSMIRLQMRMRLPAFAFFTLSIILLWFVKPYTCTSIFLTWFGMLPGQIAATTSVLLMGFITTPKICRGKGRPPLMQVWLQEFAWTEAEKVKKLAKRNQSMHPDERHYIESEPMFCVETMMKALYWSLLIYDFQEAEDSRLTLDEGCALFRPPLDQYEIFWEKSLDTKCLLAWSRERIVLAFRGTASLANVLADLQAWRLVHPPRRGHFWSRPMTHAGFHKAWSNNRLNAKILCKIHEIFTSGDIDKEKVQFLVTGHSLGGALASLAAWEMRSAAQKLGIDAKVSCYTFGCPRTGNHAFAKDFERLVPDTWHCINDQDIVARGGKMVFLYKRGGHRVLINSLGDLIVRPSPMETSMRLVPCTGSVGQHLLTSYLQSLLAVLLAQFSEKRLKGGMGAVVDLARDSVPLKKLLLQEAGLSFEDLVYMSRWGGYVGDVSKLPMTGRKPGAAQRDMNNRKLDSDKAQTTRGGVFCGCCRGIGVRIKEAKSSSHAVDEEDPKDANLRDGGDV